LIRDATIRTGSHLTIGQLPINNWPINTKKTYFVVLFQLVI